jgi:ribosomal-protein-alanine N-acetyltransferase
MSVSLTLSHLSNLHSQCFDKPWTPAQFEGLEVIAEGEKGFVAFQTVIDECEIKTICVLPEFRRQGIAEKLMKQLIQNQQNNSIFLEVEESNTPATSLYKKLGFDIFSARKDYYGTGKNALLMKLSS